MSNVTKSESYINDCILQVTEKLVQEFNGKERSLPVFEWMHYCRFKFLNERFNPRAVTDVLTDSYDTIMKLTVSEDFGLIRGTADREGMFRGVDGAQTYRAMVRRPTLVRDCHLCSLWLT